MKYGSKIDANQPEIVKALRAAGCTVEHLHTVGKGCPDLLCAIAGHNFLIEVKDGSKDPSAQKLKPTQVEWHAKWNTDVYVVNSVAVALAVVERYKLRAMKEAA